MINNDRYYEPEDNDDEEMDEYIYQYIKEEMREGESCDPKNPENFIEAAMQLRLSETLEQWQDATEAEMVLVVEYWQDIAEKRAIEAYFNQL